MGQVIGDEAGRLLFDRLIAGNASQEVFLGFLKHFCLERALPGLGGCEMTL